MASAIKRRDHFGGRPRPVGRGSNGLRTAHSASVSLDGYGRRGAGISVSGGQRTTLKRAFVPLVLNNYFEDSFSTSVLKAAK